MTSRGEPAPQRGRGLVVVLSGPSGVGKTTIAQQLTARGDALRIVTATTRPPREGEVHGKDYLFISREAFTAGIDRGHFLEYAEVFGNFYGTPLAPVRQALAEGRTALLLIDVQGARRVRDASVPSLSIFIAPPDVRALEERLLARAQDTREECERRLAEARRELAAQNEYDHVVVNDCLRQAVGDVARIIAARRARPPACGRNEGHPKEV